MKRTIEEISTCGIVPVVVLEDVEQAIPTGGISQANVEEYAKNPRIQAVGGSWMVSRDMINAGDFEGIAEKSARATALFREIRGL